MTRPIPSAETLRSVLRYEPATGLLWWKVPEKGRRLDRPAGHRCKQWGYVIVGLDYEHYRAHHLIWCMVTGSWPEREIDHKNRVRHDNCWKNLRQGNPIGNRANSSLRSDNTSGLKGVSWHKPRRKWRARVYIEGKEKHLGLFFTAEEAHAAYAEAALQEYGDFAHVG